MSERKKCIIFDVDGTLSDLQHRVHLVSGKHKDWDEFDRLIPLDKPIPQTIFLNQLLYKTRVFPIFACSGRGERNRDVTMESFKKWGVHVRELMMRPNGDFRADHIIKMEMLQKIRDMGYEPFIIFDDRQSVTDAWRKEGLFVLQADPNPSETFHDCFEFHDSIEYPLTILVGPSAAGKSTYAAGNWKHDPSCIISSDGLRETFTGDFKDQSQNERVFKTMHELATARLKLGLPVVIDATNLKNADRLANAKLVPPTIKVAYHVINRDLDEKMKWAGWREHVFVKGGKNLIEYHDQTFNSNLKDILLGDGLPNVTVFDLRKNK